MEKENKVNSMNKKMLAKSKEENINEKTIKTNHINSYNQIEEILKEIRNEQLEIKESIEKYHKVNMKKFAKLREFHEILDMTNQVFEKRISNIEKILAKTIK